MSEYLDEDVCKFLGESYRCLLWGLTWQELLICGLVFGLIFLCRFITLLLFTILHFVLKNYKIKYWFPTIQSKMFKISKYMLMITFARLGYSLLQIPTDVDDVLKFFIIIPVYLVLLVWTSSAFDTFKDILVLRAQKRKDNAETEEKRIREEENYNTVRSLYEEGLRVIRYVVFLVIILIGLGATDSVDVAALLESSSVVGLALVFALQPWLRNMVGGVFIFADLKFRINDKIRVVNQAGVVEDVTLRFTKMKRSDNVQVFVPNSRVLEQPVYNYSRRKSRVLEIRLNVDRTTPAAKLRSSLKALETQITNMHPDLLSHYANQHEKNGGETSETSTKHQDQEAVFFAGMAGWMEILVLVRVSGDSLNEEEFAKLKTELLLRIREILEQEEVQVREEKVVSKEVLMNPDNLYRLDYLISEDDIDQSIMATALFQL